MKVLQKAEREIADGRLWRAKEMLQGSIAHAEYNADVYEMLGNVLLRMGDIPEAGRFLFLSGARKPEYEEAIGIFLRKCKGKPYNLFRRFPSKARLKKFSDYPLPLAAELRQLGFQEPRNVGRGVVSPESRNYLAPWLIFFAIVAAIFALIILGIVKLVEIIFG